MRIIVLGYIVRFPLGGMTWHYLQYVLGLRALGHDAYFFEDSDDFPSCYDPCRHITDENPAFGLKYAGDVFSRVGLANRWAYYDAHAGTWMGPLGKKSAEIASSADVVLNVSGACPIRPWTSRIPIRVFIDTDPVFTQIRHLTIPAWRGRTAQHTHFFTFGENFGRGTATIPDDGWPWKPTRQPVVLEQWPVFEGNPEERFTTVMQWDSYPSREYEGKVFGMKSAAFEPFIDFPRIAQGRFELALGSPHAPRGQITTGGWSVVDPLEVTRDPWTYQRYILGSKAEFTVAKHGYVEAGSGWFSERSASYLACGRPVITENTGFDSNISTGEGLLTFSSIEEAICAVDEVNSNYRQHCRAAREVAGAFFDAGAVLRKLIDRL